MGGKSTLKYACIKSEDTLYLLVPKIRRNEFESIHLIELLEKYNIEQCSIKSIINMANDDYDMCVVKCYLQ